VKWPSVFRRGLKRPLDEALDWIAENSVLRNGVDWVTLRQSALVLAEQTESPVGAYRAIRFVLERLGDVHGGLLPPAEVGWFQKGTARGMVRGHGLSVIHPERVVVHLDADGPATRSGVLVGDVVEAVNGQTPVKAGQAPLVDLGQDTGVELTLRREHQAQPMIVTLESDLYTVTETPRGQRLDANIGYVNVPSALRATAQSYVNQAHQIIQALDHEVTGGWVVDLRHNLGGDLYMMIAGLGPLLGEGEVGGLVNASGIRRPWVYRNGSAFLGSSRRASTNKPYCLKNPAPNVAILTSRLTASAGEAIVMAFRGSFRTRSFGELTAGVPTGLENKKLSDGSLLRLSTTLFSDRTGYTSISPILPDQVVAPDWTLLGTERDPVLRSATDWLSNEADLTRDDEPSHVVRSQ